jgi:hypothetical protein
MKALTIGLILLAIINVQSSYAQQPPTESIKTATNNTPEQQEVINLSKQKWQMEDGLTHFFTSEETR